MKAGVITFPGSNCDNDIVYILSNFFDAKTDLLWYNSAIENKYDLLVVPGGFSYGDYLRPGAIARFAPAMQSLGEHVKKGGSVVGICNGFQILCEAQLLPGALIRNRKLKHICKSVNIIPNQNNPCIGNLADKKYFIPVSHSDGNYRIDADGLKSLQDNNQIAWYYDKDINGSIENIAGVCDKNNRVLGMMPHPERAVDPQTGKTDGVEILSQIIARALN